MQVSLHHCSRGQRLDRQPSRCSHATTRVVQNSSVGQLSQLVQSGLCRLRIRSRPQKRCSRHFNVRASTAAAGLTADNAPESQPSFQAFLQAFWKFLRPHTIRGTILGSCAITARTLLENPTCFDWGLVPRACLGVLALLCGNGYIVGINQIYDVHLDVINKPSLPIAAGELSKTMGWLICIALAVAGLAISAINFGSPIPQLYGFGLFLGTIYSVPPIRLRENAVAAFMIIATVRGFLLNFGVHVAVRAALGLPFQWSPPITFITIFVTVFAVVIAITKDLADVEGDRKFEVDTFATKLGVQGCAFLGTGLLLANYLFAVILAFRLPGAFNVPLMVGSHVLLAIGAVYITERLNARKYTKEAVQQYYAGIWNCFYSEYLLLPFI